MDNKIYDQAHEILSERRTKAQRENDMRIREINEKIPQIREINDALYNTGRDLIRIISEAKGGNVQDRIEKMKQRNLEAQSISRQLLAANGYPENYLDIRYTCEKCSDTGYIGSEICSCLNSIFAKLSAKRLNEKAHLSLSSFDTFDLRYYRGDDLNAMQKILSYAKSYAAGFTPPSESILMFGNTGLGKTHISLAIAGEVLKKGYSVIYDPAMNILREIEKEHFSYERSSEMLDAVCDTDLLILDDLGTEFESKFYNSAVYNIINSRLVKEKATIINTNLDFSAISARYGGKVASRIITMYTCLEFKGEDVRLQKKAQKMNK